MIMKLKRIGVSKLAPNYEAWLKKADKDIEIINLYELPVEEAIRQCQGLSGILLTGGSDIHPSLYGRSVDLYLCQNIDEKRDELELALIELSFSNKIPLMGICRGLQILNVAKKGTLHADIPKYFNSSVPHSGETDVEHRVNIKENSLLYSLTGINTGVVNSSHHQSINNLGHGLNAAAHGPDFIVEAIECNRTHDHPFCLAVQWHPERMDFDNPLSGKLGKGFLEATC